MDERQARMALCALQPMGRPELAGLVATYGAEEVWHGICNRPEESTWTRKAQGVSIESLVAATKQAGARFLIPGDPDWPQQLDDLGVVRANGIGGVPLGLWVLGDLAAATEQTPVAIVGSRACTSYGSHVTTDLAAELAGHGHPIISGLAYGVDAAAHRGSLAARGVTAAFVACGIDRVYPTSHAQLHAEVVKAGAVITEAPPGASPMKVAFLARNRLIAALASGVILTEAAARSGARNTVTWAQELGRQVMAVPGPVTAASSATPNWLIQEGGASLITSAADVERLMGPLQPELEFSLRGETQPLDRLAPSARAVREAMGARELVSVLELTQRTGLAVPQILASLGELEEGGWVEQSPGGQWCLPTRPTRNAS